MLISDNQVVLFHYRLTNTVGECVGDSQPGQPLAAIQGRHQIVAGLEQAFYQHQAGDRFTVELSPEQAYGERDERLIYDVDAALFSAITDLAPGLLCHVTNPAGEQELVRVLSIDDDVVQVDANHPCAGQTLHFAVEIVAVRAATPAELSTGLIEP